MPAAVGSIVFARQVTQISFLGYFEVNIYSFIYLFIRMLRPIYRRKHVFYQKLIILKLPILVSYESKFGAVQILIVLQGVHDMTWVCSVWTDGPWQTMWT